MTKETDNMDHQLGEYTDRLVKMKERVTRMRKYEITFLVNIVSSAILMMYGSVTGNITLVAVGVFASAVTPLWCLLLVMIAILEVIEDK